MTNQETGPSREAEVTIRIDRRQLELLADLMRSLINEGYFLDRSARIDKFEDYLRQKHQELPVEEKMKREEIEDHWGAAGEFLRVLNDLRRSKAD